MLITARFTPNQNKTVCTSRLAAAFDSLAQPVLHPLFHSLSVSVSRARSLFLSLALALCFYRRLKMSRVLCVDRAMLFLQVFSIALMYAYQNIQMFTLACIRNCDTNT